MVFTPETLREARRQRGWTQRELGRRSGVHQPTIAAFESGRRALSQDAQDRLVVTLRNRPSVALEHGREAARAIVDRHHGRNARVFGSVARGDDTFDSDLDLMVDLPEGSDLFDVLDLSEELAHLLGVPVEIVSGRTSGPVHDRARAESVPL